jgi:hypothetical protein
LEWSGSTGPFCASSQRWSLANPVTAGATPGTISRTATLFVGICRPSRPVTVSP